MFEFRKYKLKQGKKKVKHPKLIVDDYKNEFGFMGLTHNKNKGKKHRNFKLKVNPEIDLATNKHKKRDSFLRKKIEYDKKSRFGGVLNNYFLDEEDKKEVRNFVEKHKKR